MIENKFKLLAGPCVIESEDSVMLHAEALKRIVEKFDIDFYFKASWDKANRTKATNYRGPGLDEGLRILDKAKTQVGVKIVTDILGIKLDDQLIQAVIKAVQGKLNIEDVAKNAGGILAKLKSLFGK